MIWGSKKLKAIVGSDMIENVNPASVNLRLGHTFLRPVEDQVLSLGERIQYIRYEVADGETIAIRPGQFMLATTIEYVEVPVNAAAFVQGRSSIGRAGLTVQNAGFVDPGFKGHITLELKNDSPCIIRLFPGYPVTQLVYMDAEDVEEGYSGKYLGQVEATGSRMHLDGITPEKGREQR